MKIAWATPFNPKSAIGRFSLNVVHELANRGHEVVVIRTEIGDAAKLRPVSTDVPSVHYMDPGARDWINRADVLATNIGDHYEFHAGVLNLDYPIPTVGIFHDWCIVNFFYAWALDHGTHGEARRIMERLHGGDAWKSYSTVPAEDFQIAAANNFPMTGWMAEKVDCAVIHSRFYQDLVSTTCAGSVIHLPLAYPAHPHTMGVKSGAKTHGEKFQLYTFGMVNPNKRIEQVIRVIGSDDRLRESIRYVVDGYVTEDYRAHLLALADQLSVDLVLNGPATDEALSLNLMKADAVCCLRYPALEGASASAIEAMQAGCPVLVTDTGFYAELPDRYVYKIDAANEMLSLERTLKSVLTQNPIERRRFGAAAAAWATEEFGAPRYADGIEGVFRDAIRNQHLGLVSRRLAEDIHAMMISPGDPLVDRAYKNAEQLFRLPSN